MRYHHRICKECGHKVKTSKELPIPKRCPDCDGRLIHQYRFNKVMKTQTEKILDGKDYPFRIGDRIRNKKSRTRYLVIDINPFDETVKLQNEHYGHTFTTSISDFNMSRYSISHGRRND